MISEAELEKAFKGQTFVDTTPDGKVGTVTFGTDMTIHATGPSPADADEGTYRFANGGYCSKWKKQRAGVEWCFQASKVDNGYQLWTTDGKKADLFTFK